MKSLFHKAKYLPIYLISFLPFPLLYLLSDLVRFFVFRVFSYRKPAISGNLRRSFPEKTEAEIKGISRAFHRQFCDQIFESIKLLSMSEKQAKRRFMVKNPELFQHLYEQHTSILIYMGHMGNWDYFAIAPLLLPHQFLAFYKPQKTAYINDLIIGERERFGVITIPSKKGYRALMDYARKDMLTAVLLLGDQRPPPHSKRFWTHFLNQETAFLIGTERMAQKSKQAVVYPHVLKGSRGRYQVEFIPLLPDQEKLGHGDLIKAYALALEKNIREQPELWLWSHKRWKKARPADEVLHA